MSIRKTTVQEEKRELWVEPEWDEALYGASDKYGRLDYS